MKSKVVLFSFLALVVFLSMAFANNADLPSSGSYTKHYEQSLFNVTEKGLFSVEIVSRGNELKVGANTLGIIVHDKTDKDVVGAAVTVTPWMPEMGHGVHEKPVVREMGGGLYSAENIIFIMGGHWQLRIKIKMGDMEDSITFDFPDVKISERPSSDEHNMMHSSAPADVDTATVRISAKNLFKVSYTSENVPIPVGRIIAWNLNVETVDGRPVKNAEILVNGGMPEHGHGLPTQPEVSEGTKDGNYIVEGLKFNMPGWWVMTFKVKTGDMDDSVTFNVVVR